MKRLIRCLALFAICFTTTAVSSQSNLIVTITNLKNVNGDILVGLYDKARSFPRHVMDGKVVKVTEREMVVTFPDIKPGNYAVSVLHDENQNKDMDQTGLGIPKEGFGFSNDAMGMIGPPSFKRAKVSVPEHHDTDIFIKMKYMKAGQ
jgi:uncharacterized protein (DUF2141 family)